MEINIYLKNQDFIRIKIANAQEAHECIRPTDISKNAERFEFTRYKSTEIIRTNKEQNPCSQMGDEISETTTVIIKDETKSNSLKAVGRVIVFEGFRKSIFL